MIRLWQRWVWDPQERRLRLVWRFLLHGALALTLASGLSLPAACAALVIVPGGLDLVREGITGWWIPILMATTAAGITLATLVARKALDRRDLASLGLKFGGRMATDLAAGTAIAAAMMGLVLALEAAAGSIAALRGATLGGLELIPTLAVYAVVFAASGFGEELMSRGYHLVNLREALGDAPALVISALIFSVLHLGNPSAGWGSIAGILGAGLLLGVARLWSSTLWLAVGIHFGWNFFEGNVFGFRVSGLSVPALLQHQDAGPAWFTGGGFGPEAGAVLLPALLLGLLLLRLYTRSVGHGAVPPEPASR